MSTIDATATDRALSGLDAGRRAGWAKYYEERRINDALVAELVATNRRVGDLVWALRRCLGSVIVADGPIGAAPDAVRSSIAGDLGWLVSTHPSIAEEVASGSWLRYRWSPIPILRAQAVYVELLLHEAADAAGLR